MRGAILFCTVDYILEIMQKIIKNFIQAPVAQLGNLDNLFIELSHRACNLRCKHCYIEKNPYKQEKDFIETDRIKRALGDLGEHKLKSIYLTGGEPLLHPDFNQILRMCLKVTSTTILTNGMLVNEKKARFLRKIDDESEFETIYRISFEHFDELKNDDLRGRGSFRKAFNAAAGLIKYGFNPIISTVNYYGETREALYDGFYSLFKKIGFDFESINLKITPYIKRGEKEPVYNFSGVDVTKVDCINSRTLSKKGVFSCPMLSGDFRARMGNDLANFSKRTVLDTDFCQDCLKHDGRGFANDWD